MVSISNKDLYENITINKIYLDIPNSRFEQSINNNNNKKDYDNIFNNISLNYIKNNSNKLISNIEITKNNKIQSYNDNNITNNFKFEKDNNITNNFKFEKDSFINELSNLLMKNTREIRNEIKNFVNSSENLDYLKKLTRSYKKFIIDIHNLLVNDNIDKIITDNLLIIICKLYNINIIIFKENIYKIYENNNSSDYYVFEKYIKNNENNKNNKNNKYINFRLIDSIKNINDFLKVKKIYKDEKELKNMKLDELRNLANKNKIVSTKKKIDLINELNKIYNLYN
tara:strand:- start:790 stop:1641 length:852 start_codon:yes stop_codon:yes gene_type:complete